MIQQGSFFDDHLGPFPSGAPETSRQAALDNYPRSGTQRRRVYDAIVSAGEEGCTREELSGDLSLPLNSVLPRVWELMKMGLVATTDRRRRTGTGSKAAVIVAIDLAEEAGDG